MAASDDLAPKRHGAARRPRRASPARPATARPRRRVPRRLQDLRRRRRRPRRRDASRSGRGEFVFLVGSDRLGQVDAHAAADQGARARPRARSTSPAATSASSPHKQVPYYRRNIGVVFQDFKLLPNRTVHDNVAYALQVTGSSRKEIRAKVPDILRLTGLSTKLHNYPDQLSGGEQQRVSRRARVRQPPAAAAGRRADRQPRPRDVDRDHAAALPDQPHRHDRRRRHARQRDGRPHAPPRDRASTRAASSATSSPAATRDADVSTAEFGALHARAGAAAAPHGAGRRAG